MGSDRSENRDRRALAAAAIAEVGIDYDLARLTGFLETVARVTGRHGRLQDRERVQCRRDGAGAAAAGVTLPALVDLYLSAARLLWTDLVSAHQDSASHPKPAKTGEVMLRAIDDALAQVAVGYTDAHAAMLQREAARRRDFVEDLLNGNGDMSNLLSRAEYYGLTPASSYFVIVLGARSPLPDVSVAASDLETAIRTTMRGVTVMVTAWHGKLVVALQSSVAEDRGRPPETRKLAPLLLDWASRIDDQATISVSRCRRGPSAVAACFREAEEGLTLARSVGWRGRIVHADELAVFRVLLRDRESMVELVESVLSPLRTARGGASPLVETLYQFMSCGAVATEAARRLHLSVRAVTYRLTRIRELTGYDPTGAEDRLTLHVAVTGAYLLGWAEKRPEEPTLPTTGNPATPS